MKRLIVLCDGTWLDSTATTASKYPSNVTRISRSLSPYATKPDGTKIPQIVFYQAGVGTALGSKWRGGIYGAGLSADIRAAYGFLCHNWEEGDEIFFFGFSRGAYTVRSIAGLTSSLGLLTKRGMDKFPQVYEQYYNHGAGKTAPEFDSGLLKELTEAKDIRHVGSAIKIIGVWDTVGFHWSGWTGEKIEFYNQTLSPQVEHAYHALSLDEGRAPYAPTLWEIPRDAKNDLQQVWFSGVHSEVGGGLQDSRLPDISLAWMIARCAENEKLAFTDGDGADDPPGYYLLDHSISQAQAAARPWGTSAGPSELSTGLLERLASFFRSLVPFRISVLGDRMPKSRVTRDVATNESVHCSIRDRDFRSWPCVSLRGTHSGVQWDLTNTSLGTLQETTTNTVEARFKGRIRPVA